MRFSVSILVLPHHSLFPPPNYQEKKLLSVLKEVGRVGFLVGLLVGDFVGEGTLVGRAVWGMLVGFFV